MSVVLKGIQLQIRHLRWRTFDWAVVTVQWLLVIKMFVVSKKKIKKKYFNKNVNSTCVRGVEIKVTLYDSAIVRAIHCQIGGVT